MSSESDISIFLHPLHDSETKKKQADFNATNEAGVLERRCLLWTKILYFKIQWTFTVWTPNRLSYSMQNYRRMLSGYKE